MIRRVRPQPDLVGRFSLHAAIKSLWGTANGRGLRIATFGFVVGATGAVIAALTKVLQDTTTEELLRFICSFGIVLGWSVMVIGTATTLLGILVGWWTLLSREKR